MVAVDVHGWVGGAICKLNMQLQPPTSTSIFVVAPVGAHASEICVSRIVIGDRTGCGAASLQISRCMWGGMYGIEVCRCAGLGYTP